MKRERMLENCRSMQIGSYVRKTATIFQRMIRAEEAAQDVHVPAVIDGRYVPRVYSPPGYCVCCTCGDLHAFEGTNRIDSGHFLQGRGVTYVFEETGVHPQCVRCNKTEGGAPAAYELYVWERYGHEEVARLRALKADTSRHWWYHADRGTRQEWIVDKRIEFQARLNAALKQINS